MSLEAADGSIEARHEEVNRQKQEQKERKC